jgi:hypothetical protein
MSVSRHHPAAAPLEAYLYRLVEICEMDHRDAPGTVFDPF